MAAGQGRAGAEHGAGQGRAGQHRRLADPPGGRQQDRQVQVPQYDPPGEGFFNTLEP